MTSIRRIQANQQNAQLSTGPRTLAGKAIVSQNALRSGVDSRALIIVGEDPVELDFLHSEYYDRWNPTTPEQRALVDTLISNEWLLRRYRCLETHLWQNSMPTPDSLNPAIYLAQAFGCAAPLHDRVTRHKNAAQRSYQSALRDLKLLKKEELAAPEPLNPTPIGIPSPQLLDPEPTSSPFGFVPQAARSGKLPPARGTVPAGFWSPIPTLESCFRIPAAPRLPRDNMRG